VLPVAARECFKWLLAREPHALTTTTGTTAGWNGSAEIKS
jgi:hypothetical protein